jgi:lipid II:glycine glycyltransferase (peptidoglycan interpeptide bridge formation enzyme)
MGCEQYDLGGIDPDNNPGVYHFKKGIGGVETRLLGCFEAAAHRRVATLIRHTEAWYRRLRMLRSNYSRFQVKSRRGTLHCSQVGSTSCSL